MPLRVVLQFNYSAAVRAPLLEQLKAAGASKIFSGVRRQPWLFLPQRAIATVESDYVVHRHLKRGRLVAALPPQRRRVG